MNWSHLLTLIFGHGCHVLLLEALIGLVPQLRTLHLGFWCNTGAASDLWNLCEDPGVIERFLKSIKALERVKMDCEDDSSIHKLYPALFKQHSKSLRQVEVKFRALVAWEAETFSELANRCRAWRSLRVPMKLRRVLSAKGGVFVWPDVPSKPRSSSWAALVQLRKPFSIARLKRLFSGPEKRTNGNFKPFGTSTQSHGDNMGGSLSTKPESSPRVPSTASRQSPNKSVLPSIHTSLTSLHQLQHLHLEI